MKKIFVIIMAVMFSIVLVSCNSEKIVDDSMPSNTSVEPSMAASEQVPAESATPIPTVTPTVESDESSSASDIIPGSIGEYLSNEITFEYYDAEDDETKTAVYKINGDATANTAFDAVNELYLNKVLGIDSVKPNFVIISGGFVFFDFTDDIYELNLDSSGEIAVLDSISDAYLSNVKDVKAIYFTVNGEPYSSDNFEFSKEEPYKSK